ncbi:acyltransferase [Patescibacteria group bacterium]|nr:acyltransferase [Patescibacteria group bacterium]
MTRFSAWKQPTFNRQNLTQWNWMCQHRKNFKLGKNSDIGAFTYINARFGVEIEADVQIGSHCSIYSHNTIDNTKGKVIIKQGAKIGSHTVILPGVLIGKNALIGAHSLVKNDVKDNAVMAGVPVKEIK